MLPAAERPFHVIAEITARPPYRLPAVLLLTPMPGATGLPLLPSAALLPVTTQLPLPMPTIARLPVPSLLLSLPL